MIKIGQLIYDISFVAKFNLTRWLCLVMIHEPLCRTIFHEITASVVLHLVTSPQRVEFHLFLSLP
jgi:hypothetical protein